MPETGDSATAQMQGLQAPEESQDPSAVRDVFVSYATLDAAVANAAVAALERHGLKCWIAPRDVMPGSLYADGIVRAINGAKVFALVLSEHAVASARSRLRTRRQGDRAGFFQAPADHCASH
jgi:TIR domain